MMNDKLNNFLKKIKLIDTFEINLQLSQHDFIDKLSAVTEKGNLGIFSESYFGLKKNKKEYIGQISYDSFSIRKQRSFPNAKNNSANATGTMSEDNGNLKIDTEINGFKSTILIFYVCLIFFYAFALPKFLNTNNEREILLIVFFVVQGVFMFTIPYIMMRLSVRRFKYDLERELFFLTKND